MFRTMNYPVYFETVGQLKTILNEFPDYLLLCVCGRDGLLTFDDDVGVVCLDADIYEYCQDSEPDDPYTDF